MDMNEVLYQTMLERMELMETSIKSISEKGEKFETALTDSKSFSECLNSIQKRLDEIKAINEPFRNRDIQSEYNNINKQIERTFNDTLNKIIQSLQINEKTKLYYKVINFGLVITLITFIIWIISLNYDLANTRASAIKYEYLKALNSPKIKRFIDHSDSIYEEYGYEYFNKRLDEYNGRINNTK